MKIDIFCDSGESVGLGHIRRCENLILHLQNLFSFIDFEVSFHSYPFVLPSYPLELVIIDSYLADLEFYHTLSQLSTLLILDDTHRLEYPQNSLILRPTFGATPFSSQCYAGSEYIILHPIFYSPLPSTPPIANQILITLGGSNQNALISKILSYLPPCYTPIILNPFFPHHNSLCHLSQEEICKLIDSSEFVITAGGGSLNEAFMRSKKIIALCLADNQLPQFTHYPPSPSLAKLTCLDLLHTLPSLLDSLSPATTPPTLGNKLPSLLTLFLHTFITSKLPNLQSFHTLSPSQKLEVLTLRNQQGVREASLNTKLISKEEHFSFIASLKASQFYFAYLQQNQIAGVLALSITSKHKALISLYKDLNLQKIGDILVDYIDKIASFLGIQTLELEVLQNNTKAICFYQKHQFFITKENQHTFIMQKTYQPERTI